MNHMMCNPLFGKQESQESIVTGFERTRLPRTQQEDTLFTITR